MTGFFQSIITIVLFLAILGILVVIHELGHFVTARLANVRVLEFGVGTTVGDIAPTYIGGDLVFLGTSFTSSPAWYRFSPRDGRASRTPLVDGVWPAAGLLWGGFVKLTLLTMGGVVNEFCSKMPTRG